MLKDYVQSNHRIISLVYSYIHVSSTLDYLCLSQIFIGLPPRDFEVCRGVCRSWRQFIDGEILGKRHVVRARKRAVDRHRRTGQYLMLVGGSLIDDTGEESLTYRVTLNSLSPERHPVSQSHKKLRPFPVYVRNGIGGALKGEC